MADLRWIAERGEGGGLDMRRRLEGCVNMVGSRRSERAADGIV